MYADTLCELEIVTGEKSEPGAREATSESGQTSHALKPGAIRQQKHNVHSTPKYDSLCVYESGCINKTGTYVLLGSLDGQNFDGAGSVGQNILSFVTAELA